MVVNQRREEYISGCKTTPERELVKLLELMKQSDILVLCKLILRRTKPPDDYGYSQSVHGKGYSFSFFFNLHDFYS